MSQSAWRGSPVLELYRYLSERVFASHPSLVGVARAVFESRVIAAVRQRLIEEPDRRGRAGVTLPEADGDHAKPVAPLPEGAPLADLIREAQRQLQFEMTGGAGWATEDASALAQLWLEPSIDFAEETVRERFELLVDGLIDSLHDPHCQAIHSRNLLQSALVELLGTASTLGLEVQATADGGFAIEFAIDWSDAARKGVRRGDRLLSVDGRSVAGHSLREVQHAIERPCRMHLARGADEEYDVAVGICNPQQALTRSTLLDGEIGWISFPLFRAGAIFEVRDAVRSLVAQGARALLLDLRGNPGGLVNEAGLIANLFIREGCKVIETLPRVDEDDADFTTGPALFPDLPLVVLVDRCSASAAEVIAAAFQDEHRALLVGETTYGKGVGQSTLQLRSYVPGSATFAPGFTATSLTTFELRSPLGRDWHHVGLVPDLRAATAVESMARIAARARFLDDPWLDEKLLELALTDDEIAQLRKAGPPPPRVVAAAKSIGAAPQGDDEHEALKDVARLLLQAANPALAACPEIDPVLAKALRAARLALRSSGG